MRSWTIWVVNLGLLLVMVATMMPLLRVDGLWYKYVYVAGALLCLVGQLFTKHPEGLSLREKRLYRIEAFSAIFFCVGAFFMFYRKYGVGPTDWIAFTLAGAVLRIYTSIMLPRARRSAS